MPINRPLQMVSEVYVGNKAVFSAPLSLDGESDGDYRAPNILQRVLSLLTTVRPGSDLSRFQLPPLFNLPKSQLQCYGESQYCTSEDLLSKCAGGENPAERLVSVVAWHLSTFRPLLFGLAPYNPVLGETHHVSRASLTVLLEQVSHHPPVSALHMTDETNKIEVIGSHHPVSKFCGTHVETEVQGIRKLKLLNKDETYLMTCPKLVMRFLPVPAVEWVGNVTIRCPETGLEAEVCYKSSSILGRRANHRSLKGKVFYSSSLKTVYEINGHWDRVMNLKDINTGEVRVICNMKEVLSGLKTPIVKDPRGVEASESAVVWSEVSKGILGGSWDKAREAKTAVEERERQLAKDRQSRGESAAWVPKHFTVSYSKENGWECSPKHKTLPPAPIVVPLS